MNLQSIINIDVDFYDKKYILVNAKQLDKGSRFLLVTCYNHGTPFSLDSASQSVYIRYKKADDYSVFNLCEINNDGKILVELTEQMLAVAGICEADLVIVNKRIADVDKDTLEVAVKNAEVLSTMTFFIDVSEIAAENSEIESSYEYNGLNKALAEANAEYSTVIKWARSYATGDGDVRDNEETDNAKYYYEQSLNNASNASQSEINAKTSETNAKTSETNAAKSESSALTSANNALTYMNNAKNSETASALSESNAKTSEANASVSETNAKASELAAKLSETNAATSESNAKASETNANTYMTNTDEYMKQTEEYKNTILNVVNGLNSGFIPMGTITFAELATVEKAVGFTYNISDDFVTNETFAEGAGKQYTAGTNVYCRYDGLWDCFGGSASVAATVAEVKEYLGI